MSQPVPARSTNEPQTMLRARSHRHNGEVDTSTRDKRIFTFRGSLPHEHERDAFVALTRTVAIRR